MDENLLIEVMITMGQQQTALEPTGKTIPVLTERDENIFDQIKETAQKVAHRAFELFEKRGREFGSDLEDWLRAESELVRRVPIEVKETDDKLEIRAEIPGFKPEELKIFIEPERLTINGETEQSAEEKKVDTLYSEWHSRKVFRAFDLPRKVKTDGAEATLKDGILSLTLPKAEKVEPQKITVKTD